MDEFGRGRGGAPIVQATYTGTNGHRYRIGNLALAVTHPYAAAPNGGTSPTGGYMSQTITKEVSGILPFTIVHAWGDPSGLRRSGEAGRQRAAAAGHRAARLQMCGKPHPWMRATASASGHAAAWIVQSSKAAHLHAQIAGSVYQPHHSVGVVTADVTLGVYSPYTAQTFALDPSTDINNYPYYWNVLDKFDRMDVDTAFSLTSKTADPQAAAPPCSPVPAVFDALEGSVVAQGSDLPDISSAATRFAWADGAAGGGGRLRLRRGAPVLHLHHVERLLRLRACQAENVSSATYTRPPIPAVPTTVTASRVSPIRRPRPISARRRPISSSAACSRR